MIKKSLCSVPDCGRPVFGHGFCNMHYKRWRKTGDPGEATPLLRPDRGCSVDGCPEPHAALGFCATHWRRFKDSGKAPTTPIRRFGAEKPQCSLWFCDEPSSVKGYCSRHYGRLRSWGTNIPGMTWVRFEEMWEEQEGRCAVCRTELLWDGKNTHVDHDHESGAIRAVLCNNCNTMIGHAGDDPERLEAGAQYLRSHR